MVWLRVRGAQTARLSALQQGLHVADQLRVCPVSWPNNFLGHFAGSIDDVRFGIFVCTIHITDGGFRIAGGLIGHMEALQETVIHLLLTIHTDRDYNHARLRPTALYLVR